MARGRVGHFHPVCAFPGATDAQNGVNARSMTGRGERQVLAWRVWGQVSPWGVEGHEKLQALLGKGGG